MRAYVNISDNLLEQLDEIGKELNLPRTAIITISIKHYLDYLREKKAKLKNLES